MSRSGRGQGQGGVKVGDRGGVKVGGQGRGESQGQGRGQGQGGQERGSWSGV